MKHGSHSLRDPQNPYESFIVSASAGSGKTYQLSKRFLFLVAAGAAPSGILTVTFTKKAAAEMRGRILSEAARLIGTGSFQQEFESKARVFWEKASLRHPHQIPEPLPACLVGRRILEQSQLLPIATIDSLLTQWVSKFPLEASPTGTCRGRPWHDRGVGAFPSPYRLLDPHDAHPFNDLAWWAACRLMDTAAAAPSAAPPVGETLSAGGSLVIEDLYTSQARLESLAGQSTLIWYLEELFGGGLRQLPGSHIPETNLFEQLWRVLSDPLHEIADKISNPDTKSRVRESVFEKNWQKLLETGLITKSSLSVSGSLIRGKNRELLSLAIQQVDTAVRTFINHTRIQKLNTTGSSLYHLYRIYHHARSSLKYKKNFLEFSDLTQGAFRLFHGDHGSGVRFLLSQVIHHMMLDEFQDTSRLQWAIFRELGESLLGTPELSRQGPPPSLFIVGDPKQSIYGFREADPEVVAEARDHLRPYVSEVPLSTSFRTSPVVLEYINEVFFAAQETHPSLGMEEFPRHQPARTPEGLLLTPVWGGVFLAPIPRVESSTSQKNLSLDPSSEDDESSGAQTTEAMVVAAFVARLLEQENAVQDVSEEQGWDLPVFDPMTQGYRRPRASDFAVLYRSAQEAEAIEKALHARNIMTRKEEEKGFFKCLEIQDVMALVRWCINGEDRAALATVLKSPIGRALTPALGDTSILQSLWCSQKSPEGGRRAAFFAQLTSLQPETEGVLKRLMHLRSRALVLAPHQFLYEAYQELEVRRVYGGTHESQRRAAANLEKLLDLVLKLEGQGCRDLVSLSVKLDRMSEDDLMGLADSARDAVTMMTIHKAKGLEFPFVLIVGCHSPWGQQDAHWELSPKRDGIYYVGTQQDFPVEHPFFETIRQKSAERIARECGRLLYVALTRAKQYLFLTGLAPKRPRGLRETVVFPILEAGLKRLSLRPSVALSPKLSSEQGGEPEGSPPSTLGVPRALTLDVSGQKLELSCLESSQVLGLSPSGVGSAHLDRSLTSEAPGVQKDTSPEKPTLSAMIKADAGGFKAPVLPHGSFIQAPSRHQESAEEEMVRLFRTDRDHRPSAEKGGPASFRGAVVPLCPRLAKAAGVWLHRGLQAAAEKSVFDGPLFWTTVVPPEYRDLKFMEPFAYDLAQCVGDPWLRELWNTPHRIHCELPAVFKRRRDIYHCVIDLFVIDRERTPWVIDYKSTRMRPDALGDKILSTDAVLAAIAEERRWTHQLRLYQEALRLLLQKRPDLGLSTGQGEVEIKGCLYFTSLQKPLLCPSLSLKR